MSHTELGHITTTTEPKPFKTTIMNCASMETENTVIAEHVTNTDTSERDVKEDAGKVESNIKDEVKVTDEETKSIEGNKRSEVQAIEGEAKKCSREAMDAECVPYKEIKIKEEGSPCTAYEVVDSLAYRIEGNKTESEDSSDDSDDSDDSSSSSSSVSGVKKKTEMLSDRDDEDDDNAGKKKKGSSTIRTRGELYPEELPPIEELKISVDEDVEMQEIGKVASTVGVLVVVQANKEIPALNEETVLFTQSRQAFGKIFEVFGPVASPFYSVRFNSPEDIVNKEISVGLPLFCAPKEQEYTQFVFVEQLKKIKGSDASWENNNEPPSSCLEFSDDEDEKRMKAKNRNKTPIEGATEDQLPNKKGRNKKKHGRFENKVENSQEHNREYSYQNNKQGGRGRRQWPPQQNDSWPPRESCGWPPQAEESWPTGQANGEWMNTHRQFSPRGQVPRPFLNPGSFTGGRGPGGSPRFHNPFQQNQMRGGPPSRHLPNHNFRDNSFQGEHSQEFTQHGYDLGTNYHADNGNILMDTRLVQNPNHNVEAPPFSMMRPSPTRSTFGGQPQFSSGPMRGQFNQRPGMPGTGKFNNGPPGRW